MPQVTSETVLTVALIGNPNTGKSTLFNALAGMSARVGNFPGVTVEKKVARVRWDGREVELIDLPGTYSLSPRSPDEMIAVNVLLGQQAELRSVDVVVCIADASNLERNLYLFSQVRDLGLPTVLVLNMWDVCQRCGVQIDVAGLSERLGLPVVATSAHSGAGLPEVGRAIQDVSGSERVPTEELFPQEFAVETAQLHERLIAAQHPTTPTYLVRRMLLDVGGQIETDCVARDPQLRSEIDQARQRLTDGGCRVPAVEPRVRYDWVRRQLDGLHQRSSERGVSRSDRWDRLLTHRCWGILAFCLLMFLVFQTIYTWSGPFMDAIESGQGWVSGLVQSALVPGAFRSLLVDGIVAGVGGVLIFLPQIVLLFLFIAVLEDCGYMARAAFLMDRLMTRVGLSGKSFLPLMSSFACAIPGVMAARVIENRRDRMVTILVAPLMSCSARLPVYMLLTAAFVPATTYMAGWVTLRGLVLFGMSGLGAVVAIPVALLLKKTLFRGETPPFVMELPAYKWPSLRVVFYRVWDRSRAFVMRAGTLIFFTSILIWAAAYFPGDHQRLNQLQVQIAALESRQESGPLNADQLQELEQRRDEHNSASGRLLENSALGRVGHAIEPVVRPLGWDWRIGVGALASFPAREVIIATLGTVYSLGGDVDEEDDGLRDAMRSSKWPDGRRVYNTPVALSVMVFFALCAQCAATLMVIRRETNSWIWPAFTFVYMTSLAYVASWLTYQIGMMF